MGDPVPRVVARLKAGFHPGLTIIRLYEAEVQDGNYEGTTVRKTFTIFRSE